MGFMSADALRQEALNDSEPEIQDAEKKPEASEIDAAAFMSGTRREGERVRLSPDSQSGTQLTGSKGTKPPVKMNRYGAQKQIKWATYATQKLCLEKLAKQSGLKNTEILEIGLSLAMEHFAKKGNFDKVDRSFGTDDPE